ncbi:hypothetical protein [Ideonella sp.]|jgi:hypothetical protein|uniref:hypothetical protein n=1 Tax=Ideonella sp. TaxID=1929293 RepID=UPI0037C13E15
MPRDHVLTERAAALLLGVRASTLAEWRSWDSVTSGALGRAPMAPPHRVAPSGAIEYCLAKLRAWLASLPKVDGIVTFPANLPHTLQASRPDTVH